jgi:hypothetical protein
MVEKLSAGECEINVGFDLCGKTKLKIAIKQWKAN